MKIKLEIELSESLHRQVCKAAKNLKVTPEKYVVKALRNMTMSNQLSGDEVTESLNRFFARYPELATIEAQQYWEK